MAHGNRTSAIAIITKNAAAFLCRNDLIASLAAIKCLAGMGRKIHSLLMPAKRAGYCSSLFFVGNLILNHYYPQIPRMMPINSTMTYTHIT